MVVISPSVFRKLTDTSPDHEQSSNLINEYHIDQLQAFLSHVLILSCSFWWKPAEAPPLMMFSTRKASLGRVFTVWEEFWATNSLLKPQGETMTSLWVYSHSHSETHTHLHSGSSLDAAASVAVIYLDCFSADGCCVCQPMTFSSVTAHRWIRRRSVWPRSTSGTTSGGHHTRSHWFRSVSVRPLSRTCASLTLVTCDWTSGCDWSNQRVGLVRWECHTEITAMGWICDDCCHRDVTNCLMDQNWTCLQ